MSPKPVREDRQVYFSELGNLAECVKSAANALKEWVSAWLKVVYNVESPVEVGVALPEVGDEWVVFYGFIGRIKCDDVEVVVEPKVGWERFNRMLEEVVNFLGNLPSYVRGWSPLGVLASALFPGGHTAVYYSPIVLDLTSKFLSTFKPLSLEKVFMTSGGVVGRPSVAETLKLMSRGVPMGVFARVRLIDDLESAAVFRALNEVVKVDLEEVIEALQNAVADRRPVMPFIEELRKLVSKHEEVLRRFLATREIVVTRETLRRVREQGRVNPVTAAGVELYLSYMAQRRLLQKVGTGYFQFISTHKLYELWVLTRILKHLGRAWYVKSFNLKEGGRFVGGRVEVEYDVKRPSKLRELVGGAYIRPDVVIKDGERVFVIDVKYKDRVSEEDLGRLLLYIAELSRPYFLGVFAYLGESRVWKFDGREVRLCKADPQTDEVDYDCLGLRSSS